MDFSRYRISYLQPTETLDPKRSVWFTRGIAPTIPLGSFIYVFYYIIIAVFKSSLMCPKLDQILTTDLS